MLKHVTTKEYWQNIEAKSKEEHIKKRTKIIAYGVIALVLTAIAWIAPLPVVLSVIVTSLILTFWLIISRMLLYDLTTTLPKYITLAQDMQKVIKENEEQQALYEDWCKERTKKIEDSKAAALAKKDKEIREVAEENEELKEEIAAEKEGQE